MSGRLPDGWGNCVRCGETLKPEDKENTADRCPFCLKMFAVFSIITFRIIYCENKLKQTDLTDKGILYWKKKLAYYNSMHSKAREISKMKAFIWGESW